MENDYLIPPLAVESTNIPVGGSQVSLDITTADGSKILAGLSKTMASAMDTLAVYKDYSRKEAEAEEVWKEQLSQIHSLVDGKNFTEEDYAKIEREANGKAQREGAIRAYENWGTISAVDKERATSRAKMLGDRLTLALPRLTNPSVDFASTYEEEEALALEHLLGSTATDSQGNIVTFDLREMSPMELAHFARQRSGLEMATRAAIDVKKQQRSIEASTTRFSNDFSSIIEDVLLNPTPTMGIPGKGQNASAELELLTKMRLDQLREISDIAWNSGVENINALVFTATTDLLTVYKEDIGLMGDDPREAVTSLINQMQDDLSLRDADGQPVPFASSGTENHLNLEKLKNTVNTRLAKRLEDLDIEQPDKKDMVLAYGWNLLDAAEEEGLDKRDPEVKKEIYRLIKDYGRSVDYYEFNTVTTQFDDWFEKTEKRLNLEDDEVLHIDTALSSMVGIDTKPEADVYRSVVNQLFKEKKIDAAMRKTLNDKITKKSDSALAVTTARHEKNISWMADIGNTGRLMKNQLNDFLNATPGTSDVDKQRPAIFAVTVVNGVAQDLHRDAKKGGTFTPNDYLNPLKALATGTVEDMAIVAAIKRKIGAAAYKSYEMFLSMPIEFGEGALSEDNYLSRNAKAAQYVETLGAVYSAMQAVEVQQTAYTALEFQEDTLGLFNDYLKAQNPSDSK
jgi:hypothetical protein